MGHGLTLQHRRQVEMEPAQDALPQSQKQDAGGQPRDGLVHEAHNPPSAKPHSLKIMHFCIEQERASGVGRYLVEAWEAAKGSAASIQFNSCCHPLDTTRT